jgi:ABC-2 type transport system ATP-binding protein
MIFANAGVPISTGGESGSCKVTQHKKRSALILIRVDASPARVRLRKEKVRGKLRGVAPPRISCVRAPFFMIEVQNLTKLYEKFTAVSNLSLLVQPGEVFGLVGSNGAGKTTTLRCLAGVIPPTSGTVRLAGHEIAKEPIEAKRRLAFFPDEPRLFDYLTVAQHLAFVARIYQVKDYREKSGPLLDELELTGKLDSLPAEMSRGMKQKLAIACGLIHDPAVILFDEPLTGLDPMGIRRMKATIRQRAASGAAVIISSHMLPLLEEVCSHVIFLDHGRKVADGRLEDVVKQFSDSDASGPADLEEIFFRATNQSPAGNGAPPLVKDD